MMDEVHVTWYVLNHQGPLVQGSDGSLKATQRFNKIQLHLGDEITAVPLESGMGLFVQDDNDVARF